MWSTKVEEKDKVEAKNLESKLGFSWELWYMPVILALRRWRQKNQEVQEAWVQSETLLEKKRNLWKT
jgi:hypothetical protein